MSKLRTNIVALSAAATLLLGSAAMATPAFAKKSHHNQTISQSANGASGGKVICQTAGGTFLAGSLSGSIKLGLDSKPEDKAGPVNACSSVGGNGGTNYGGNAQ